MCYVYQTDRFKQAVKGVQFRSDITSLITRLEEMTISEASTLFSFHNPYIKKYIRDKKYRIVAKIKKCENDDVVLCLLDLFQVNSIDYKRFNEDATEYGQKNYEHLITDEILISWTESKKAEGEIVISSRIEIPDELRFWLEPPRYTRLSGSDETIVFESKIWIEMFDKEEIRDYWKDYFETLLKLVSNNIKPQDIGDNFKIATNSQRAILFTDLLIEKPLFNEIIFLIAPLPKDYTDNDIQKYIREHEYLKTVDRNRINADDIARLSARAYPSYILANDSLWKDIQKSPTANLALSGEEEIVLTSILDPDSNESLPVFINGRAGSGKSTLLLYLYTEYLYKMFKVRMEGRTINGEPLFLTYSPWLKNRALSSVKDLLLNHIKYSDDKISQEYQEYIKEIDRSFYTLKDLIWKYLPADRKAEFPDEKYINYTSFKNYYNNTGLSKDNKIYAFKNPAARKYSADLAWHVIRTYITGQSPDDYIDVDEYQSIAIKDRTISPENYNEIYQIIWEKWYKVLLENEKFWDDQKLLRTVLTQLEIDPVHAAIFCDEAQDFTRLELRFIMNLLIYRKYDFGYGSYRFLPFASAGDPFQTLNPTGFSWSGFKSLFHNEVISLLDPTNTGNINLNDQNLTTNYRSTYPLVRFFNLIQLFRNALNPTRGVGLQKGWQTKKDDPHPKLFILGKNISIEQMIQYAKDTLIIVPCDEGKECDFVNQDPELARFLKETKQSEEVLYSPIKAKGLEFPKVILYKFGNTCPAEIYEKIENRESLNESDRLELEYFLNNLYVAASRAEKFLFIIDSNEGEQKLWQYFKDDTFIAKILSMNSNIGLKEDISILNDGSEDNLKELVETDHLTLAIRFDERGTQTDNPVMLRDASRNYIKAGNNYKADICEAKALEIEEKYEAAGDIYNKYSHNKETENLYWKGMCWKKLLNHYDKHGIQGYRSVVTKYYNNVDDKISLINLLIETLDSLVSDQELKKLLEEQVVNAFMDAFTEIFQVEEQIINIEFWLRVARISEYYIENVIMIDRFKLGKVYYNCKNFKKCVNIWNEFNELGKYSRLYLLACAEIEDSPSKKMKYLYDAGEMEKVYTLWLEQESKYDLRNDDIFQPMYNYLCDNKLYDDAWKLSIESERTENITNLYLHIIKTNIDDNKYYEYSKQLIDILDRDDRWVEILNLPFLGKKTKRESLSFYRNIYAKPESKRDYIFRAIIVKYAAHSNTLPDLHHDQQWDVGVLLRNSFFDSGDESILYKYISPLEIAAVYEKIQSDNFALSIYENLANNYEVSKDIRENARKRCLVIKRRDISSYEDGELLEEEIIEIEDEYKEIAHKWGVSEESIKEEPIYPILEWTDFPDDEEISKGETIDDQLPAGVTQHTDFGIINNRDAGTINIVHSITGKNLFINLQTGELKYSDGEINRENNNGQENIDIADFEFEGDLEKYKDNYRIYFTLKGRNYKEHYPHDEE